MTKHTESLSDYVQRLMRQKKLSVRDVKERAGGKIAASYVNRIMHGKVKNLSVDKIVALAKGLETDASELFRVASGQPLQTSHNVDAALLLDTMQQAIHQPESLEVLQRWLLISPEYQQAVLKWIRFLSEQTQIKKKRRRKG